MTGYIKTDPKRWIECGMKKMQDEDLLKICIIGIPDELKTKMVCEFAPGKFVNESQKVILGVDITTIKIKVDNIDVKLIIVDITSDEFFRRKLDKLRPSYYRGALAAIITFDKSDRNSFKAVKDWYKEFNNGINLIYKHSILCWKPPRVEERDPRINVPITLVGFLNEVEEVTTVEGQNLADELGVLYYESKASDGKTIETVFHDLIIKVLRL